MNHNSVTLGVIPVSVRTVTRSDKKGNETTKTSYDKWALVAYFTDKSGKPVRAPFAQIQNFVGMGRENLVTVGSRDKMIMTALVLQGAGFNVKPYIKGGAERAVTNLHKRAESAVKRAEKVIADGESKYLATAADNAKKAWEALPDRLDEKREAVRNLGDMLALIRK